MLGFEPQTYVAESDRSANCATATAIELTILFSSAGLSLARTRWVLSTVSSHCPLSSNQRRWLASAAYENAGNRTRGCWVRSKYATFVLCSPLPFELSILHVCMAGKWQRDLADNWSIPRIWFPGCTTSSSRTWTAWTSSRPTSWTPSGTGTRSRPSWSSPLTSSGSFVTGTCGGKTHYTSKQQIIL